MDRHHARLPSPRGLFVSRVMGGDGTSQQSQRKLMAHPGAVTALGFQESHLVSTDDLGNIRVWRTSGERASGLKRAHHMRAHSKGINSLSVHTGSGSVATASDDQEARLWDARLVQRQRLVGHTSHVSSAAFDCTGGRVVTCSLDRTIRVWSAEQDSAVLVLQVGERVAGAKFFPGDTTTIFAAGSAGARVWDLRMVRRRSFPAAVAPSEGHAGEREPGGGSWAGIGRGSQPQLPEPPAAKRAATSGQEDDAGGEEHSESQPIGALALREGSMLLTSSSDAVHRLWCTPKLAGGERRAGLCTLWPGRGDTESSCAAATAEGGDLAVAGTRGGAVLAWDTRRVVGGACGEEGGNFVARRRDHKSPVTAVAVAPRDAALASGDSSGTLVVRSL